MGEFLDRPLSYRTTPPDELQYGLQAVFSNIERLHHSVTNAGNPIEMDLKTKYTVKGIGKEQTIQSKITIAYDTASGKILKVEDKWDGNLPESGFKEVSLAQLFSFRWWLHYCEGWTFWLWSFTWHTWPWQVGIPPLVHYQPASFSPILFLMLRCRQCGNSTPYPYPRWFRCRRTMRRTQLVEISRNRDSLSPALPLF